MQSLLYSTVLYPYCTVQYCIYSSYCTVPGYSTVLYCTVAYTVRVYTVLYCKCNYLYCTAVQYTGYRVPGTVQSVCYTETKISTKSRIYPATLRHGRPQHVQQGRPISSFWHHRLCLHEHGRVRPQQRLPLHLRKRGVYKNGPSPGPSTLIGPLRYGLPGEGSLPRTRCYHLCGSEMGMRCRCRVDMRPRRR